MYWKRVKSRKLRRLSCVHGTATASTVCTGSSPSSGVGGESGGGGVGGGDGGGDGGGGGGRDGRRMVATSEAAAIAAAAAAARKGGERKDGGDGVGGPDRERSGVVREAEGGMVKERVWVVVAHEAGGDVAAPTDIAWPCASKKVSATARADLPRGATATAATRAALAVAAPAAGRSGEGAASAPHSVARRFRPLSITGPAGASSIGTASAVVCRRTCRPRVTA